MRRIKDRDVEGEGGYPSSGYRLNHGSGGASELGGFGYGGPAMKFLPWP